eukprot:TRINITY_DN30883_c0_g2_i1.p1 TRINITY_DN30883_c0_g2~~TRINITY_DN30883_c0_g2_i1.p1  ORF type:complete len:564 (-),score=96.43 TRINITY_DN30883_c0_g2_i1:63-1685(-)
MASLAGVATSGLETAIAYKGSRSPSRRKALLAAALATVVVVLRRLWKFWRLRPKGVPVIPGAGLFMGHFAEFAKAVSEHRHYDWLRDWHKLFGKTFVLSLPSHPWWVVTSDPANLEHILKTKFENYPKGIEMSSRLTELLGQGIFNADGDVWLRQRKTASKMFTATLFKEHIWAVVNHNAKKLRDIMLVAEPDKPLNIFNLMNRFTLDTIGEIGFGKSIGSLEDPTSPFLRSFDRSQNISYKRFYVPGWRILRFFGIGSERETSEHFGRLDAYSRGVVRELRNSLESAVNSGGSEDSEWNKSEARKSFLGLFLEDAKKRNEDLTEDYLRDLVLNFLIAGRDTTAQALSWSLYCLCLNPEIEAKARKEILEVCGPHEITYENMNQLNYVQAVLSEALRLHPSVPTDLKVTESDDVWPDGTFVKSGTPIIYDIYSLGRDPDVWGEDANVFRPERWLEMEQQPNNYKYPVFNAGPRECLGRRLAIVEMKACLATLLPRFSLRLAIPPEDVKYDVQLTLGMGSGLPCFVTPLPAADDGKPPVQQ